MKVDNLNIEKNGSLTIDSIFEFDSPLDITLLIDRCRQNGCTLRFENEDLTIDNNYGNDASKVAVVTLYTMLAGHPKAALEYIRCWFMLLPKKNVTRTPCSVRAVVQNLTGLIGLPLLFRSIFGILSGSYVMSSSSVQSSASQIRSKCSSVTLVLISRYISLIVEGRIPVTCASFACVHRFLPRRADR